MGGRQDALSDTIAFPVSDSDSIPEPYRLTDTFTSSDYAISEPYTGTDHFFAGPLTNTQSVTHTTSWVAWS